MLPEQLRVPFDIWHDLCDDTTFDMISDMIRLLAVMSESRIFG